MTQPLTGIRIPRPDPPAARPRLHPHAGRLGRRGHQDRTARGDYANRLGLPADAPADQVAPLYSIVNRGKQVERLDLKSEAGRARLLSLVTESDALVEGFRPGVMTRSASARERCANTQRGAGLAARQWQLRR